jgi:hypothetical protein
LRAGHGVVDHYAETAMPLVLPAIEKGLFDDAWRIRASSVHLLGDVLSKITGESRTAGCVPFLCAQRAGM